MLYTHILILSTFRGTVFFGHIQRSTINDENLEDFYNLHPLTWLLSITMIDMEGLSLQEML